MTACWIRQVITTQHGTRWMGRALRSPTGTWTQPLLLETPPTTLSDPSASRVASITGKCKRPGFRDCNDWGRGSGRLPGVTGGLGYCELSGGAYTRVLALSGTRAIRPPTSSFAQDTVVGIALDMDANTLTFYFDGVSQGHCFFPAMTGRIAPWVGNGSASFDHTHVTNFGQQGFTYALPAGYEALCTANLPDPAIADGSTAGCLALHGQRYQSDDQWSQLLA